VPEVRIRAADRADLQLVASLIRELADYERLVDQVEMTESVLEESLFRQHAAEVVLAELDGEVAGFAVFFHNFSTFVGRRGLYLEDLFVRPRFRGQGVGRALMVHLARLARERGCGRMEWAVLDWNRSAIGFYERLGARPNAGWTIYRLREKDLERLATGQAVST
jgi:GNAT superfamily N-acetyltransferase